MLDLNDPLWRVWYVSSDGRRLVQLQQDRIYFNWLRLDEQADEYPSFSSIFPQFLDTVQLFEAFLVRSKIADDLVVSQFELSYVNIIRQLPATKGLDHLGDTNGPMS